MRDVQLGQPNVCTRPNQIVLGYQRDIARYASLADAKAQLNITNDDDDALVQAKINAAWAWISSYVGIDYDTVLTQLKNTDGTTTTLPSTPAPVYEAGLQLVAHLYQNREASLVGVTASALPFGFLDLLAPYRAYAF